MHQNSLVLKLKVIQQLEPCNNVTCVCHFVYPKMIPVVRSPLIIQEIEGGIVGWWELAHKQPWFNMVHIVPVLVQF